MKTFTEKREIDKLLNTKRFKKELKKYINQEYGKDAHAVILDLLVNELDTSYKNLEVLTDHLGLHIDMTVRELHGYLVLLDPKEQTEQYRATEQALFLRNHVDSLLTLQELAVSTGGYELFKSCVYLLMEEQLASSRNRVIMNSVVNRLSVKLTGEVGLRGLQLAAALLGLFDRKILALEKIQNPVTYAQEWFIQFRLNGAELDRLREIYLETKGRKILLRAPEYPNQTGYHVTTKNWNYQQYELTDSVADSLDLMNSVQLTLTDTSDDAVIQILQQRIAGGNEEISLGSEAWHKLAARRAKRQVDLVRFYGGFYLNHFFDSVGRVYEDSEMLGVQQGPAIRNLMRFTGSEPLYEEGYTTLKLVIACKMGYDKVLEEEALAAFEAHESEWRELPELAREWMIYDAGVDDGYIAYQDATNSGTQMYAVSTGATKEARVSGLLYDGRRYDAYGLLAEGMNGILGTDLYNRSNCKSSFMTKLYNAGMKRILWGRHDDVPEARVKGKHIPLMATYPEGNPSRVSTAFNQVMNLIAPDALRAMAQISSVFDSERTTYRWTAPDGFVCQVACYAVDEVLLSWSDARGNKHQMSHHLKVANPAERQTALSPRIIQSFDAWVSRELKRRARDYGIELVSIHDSWGCRLNHAPMVRQLYREVMADLLTLNPLESALREIDPGFSEPVQTGTLTREDILNSRYALWF
jgi:hypothetical protein